MKNDSKFFKYIILTDPGSLSMKERITIILAFDCNNISVIMDIH